MSFTTLTGDEEEVWQLNHFYWIEGKRCEAAQAYLTRYVVLRCGA